jgi:hypothetical protein
LISGKKGGRVTDDLRIGGHGGIGGGIGEVDHIDAREKGWRVRAKAGLNGGKGDGG